MLISVTVEQDQFYQSQYFIFNPDGFAKPDKLDVKMLKSLFNRMKDECTIPDSAGLTHTQNAGDSELNSSKSFRLLFCLYSLQ